MMSKEDGSKNCFTFIWKIKNASYWAESEIVSSSFKVDDLEETKWKLLLYLISNVNENEISFYLSRDTNSKGKINEEIDYELIILGSDGSTLRCFDKTKEVTPQNPQIGHFVSRNEVFDARSTFLPQDTLTLRCKMWKSVGEMTKNVQCVTCSHIIVQKRSFLWNIKNFSSLKSGEEITYKLKSLESDQELMCLQLFQTEGQTLDGKIRIAVFPNYNIVKTSSFQLFVVDALKNLMECYQDECSHLYPTEKKEIFLTKKKLIEKLLPDDVLSLQFEFSYNSGIVQQEGKSITIDCTSIESNVSNDRRLPKENDASVLKCILSNNLRSMVNNSFLSDIKLRTKKQTYAAHKFILGTRSPVFKAMFTNDMKEKIGGCVDIEDLNDNTVLRMLQYMYSADIEELEWVSAIELYEAADKYELLDLRDICSSFLKKNICRSNSCEALVFADLHQDKDLKSFVQDFILSQGKDVINSEEWDHLMETNLKVAAETMRLKFKD